MKIACPKCGEEIDLAEGEFNFRFKTMADEQARLRTEQAKLEMEKAYREKLEAKDLAIKEYLDKLISSQTKAQELEAKLSQGSAQKQGIIAENDLYEYLKKHLPVDKCEVEKRGQGRSGTDIIIYARVGGERKGSTIIDDKWTSNWSNEWPEKVWSDMQKHGADFALIAANPTALPEEIKTAGFGLAPCRAKGVRLWVVDRSNPALVLNIVIDNIEKLIKMSEIRAIQGAGSAAVQKFQEYLAKDYETHLREKARRMSAALKSINDIHKKVAGECEKAQEALKAYWDTERIVHESVAACFSLENSTGLPQIGFEKLEI